VFQSKTSALLPQANSDSQKDVAYFLVGIFDIQVGVLTACGEGEWAFHRLIPFI
jgi:hypothetical protein